MCISILGICTFYLAIHAAHCVLGLLNKSLKYSKTECALIYEFIYGQSKTLRKKPHTLGSAKSEKTTISPKLLRKSKF